MHAPCQAAMKRAEEKVAGSMTDAFTQTRNKRLYDQGGEKPSKTKSATGRMTNFAEKDRKPAESNDLQHGQKVVARKFHRKCPTRRIVESTHPGEIS